MTSPHLTRDQNILFAQPDGHPLHLDIIRPEGASALPVILVVHGGGWCLFDRKSAGAIPPMLARQKYVVVNCDYRLAPLHPYPAAVEDISVAVDWIVSHIGEYGGDAEHVGGIGFSSGGHLLALTATARMPLLKCAVSWGSPMDMRHHPVHWTHRGFPLAFLGTCQHEAPDLYREASPVCHFSPHVTPLLLIHGSADDVVPLSQSISAIETAQAVGADVELVILPGAGHIPEHPHLPVMHLAWQRIYSFFANHLHR